jgi:hypothetical protein
LPRHARVTAEQRSRSIELLLRGFGFGEPVEITAEEATTVERVIGVAPNGRRHRVADAGPWLTGPAQDLFGAAEFVALPHALRAITDATAEDLETARLIVVALWRHLPVMARMMAAIFDDDNYAGVSGLRHLDQRPELILVMLPMVAGMIRAGWNQQLQTLVDALAPVPQLTLDAQRVLEMPSQVVSANLAGAPLETQRAANRIIEAAIDGKLALNRPSPENDKDQ